MLLDNKSSSTRSNCFAQDKNEITDFSAIAAEPVTTARQLHGDRVDRGVRKSYLDQAAVRPHGRAAGALIALRSPTTQWVARILAWACLIAIATLSLVPGELRPHSFLPAVLSDHFVAYAPAGFFLALGYPSSRQRLFAWISLAIASGVFELLQNLVPGRSPSPVDALASTGGLTFGLAVGIVTAAVLFQTDRQVPKIDADM